MPKMLLYMSSSLSCVMIAKSLSCAGRRPRRARISAVTSSIASSRVTSSRGTTAIPMFENDALSDRYAVSNGTIARGRLPPERKLAA